MTPVPPASRSRAERLTWLRLIRSENVGPITFRRLLERFGTPACALDSLPALARQGGIAARLRICSAADAEREMAAVEAVGGRLLTLGEPGYPPLLAHVEDAPPVISTLGHAHLLAKKAIGIVGARNASANGRRFARELARDLGGAGLLVVSGMARGIDAAAHEGALATGTVAALAGGIDVVYPKENQALYEHLVAEGAVISEMPPGTEPQARHFPKRNRLISGIARGVVVVEASLRSGSLITARLALEQNREVFAVPGAPLDPRAKGTNRLIREGAVLTEGAADVLEGLAGGQAEPLAEPTDAGYGGPPAETPEEKALRTARPKVEELLGPAPVEVDEVVRAAGLATGLVAWVLLELELAGRLERLPGNRVALLPPPN